MYSSQFLSSALTLLAAAIPSVVGQYYNPVCAYFVQYTGGYLVSERVDPLLSAGVASNHVHSIAGGNGFKANMKFADTQASTCTTAQVTQDKSNYWMPVLYFNHGGKFYKVPEADDRKFYYKFGNGDCSYDQERSEFPPEFRMITGSALQREQNDTMMGSGGSQLEWVCHDGANNPKGTAGGFPTGFQSCNQPYVRGLTATMRFPSCWNGNDFDHANPLAHMAFPINKDGMAGCLAPFNHKRFPEIMIEFYFDIKSFDHITKDYSDPNNPPWVLANGDPFGYSFHLDFINGWTPGVLQKAMTTCHIADGGSNAEHKAGLASDACFGVASGSTPGYQNDDARNKCTLGQIVSPAEDIGLTGTALDKLPGCNPIQSTHPATIHAPSTCGAATAVDGGSAPAPAQADTYNTATSAAASGMSASVPVAEKLANAATSSLPTSPSEAPAVAASSPAEPSTSTSGPSSIAVKSSSGSETWEYQGCYTDLIPDRNTRSLEHWGVGDSATSCANHCFSAGYHISGTESGTQCFCGHSMKSTTKQADSDCNVACTGAASETCGGPSRLSVHAKSGTSLMKKRSAHVHRHAVKRRGSSF